MTWWSSSSGGSGEQSGPGLRLTDEYAELGQADKAGQVQDSQHAGAWIQDADPRHRCCRQVLQQKEDDGDAPAVDVGEVRAIKEQAVASQDQSAQDVLQVRDLSSVQLALQLEDVDPFE